MERGGFTYIITNKHNTVLYTGSTSDLKNRLYEHIHKVYPNSFSSRYNCNKLVFFEYFTGIEEAIAFEYVIKKWRRLKKIDLINSINSDWQDLSKLLD